MAKRIIECSVKDEYILGSGVPVGAAGSHDDVILRIAFNEMWYGLNIYAVFCNALGANPEIIALAPEMLVPGEAMTYDLPIPASAKAIEGRMLLTLAGYSVVDGADEDIATNTMQAFFRVLPSGYRVFNDNSISATIAQQLLNSINELHKKKVSLEELTAAVENAIRIAQESGEFDGADGKSAYEYAVEGGFEGSEEDFYEKLAKGGTGDFSGKYEDLEGKPIIPTKISQLHNDKEFVTQQSAEQYSNNAVNTHNASDTSHNDIRLLIEGLTARLNAFLNSDDTTLDEAKEFVAYIKANRNLIESITVSKVNVADIVDDLLTTAKNKPLSARQGVELKKLIDAITVPTLLSQLDEDATHRTVTDVEKQTWNSKSDFSGKYSDLKDKPTIPEVPEWAKQPEKPTYNKSEVGLGNVDNVRQYSADNEPPYPVTSVNEKTGKVTLSATDVGAEERGAASSAVSTHNTATDSHNDIRLLISGLMERVNALLNSDDTTLDETKEIVAYIKANKALIDSITTSKVNVADIINNLTTNVTNKPLSAAQGVVIKALIDAKLDSSKLTEAISTALAEAKASGEFDGEDGTNGKDGTDGERGTGILKVTTAPSSYTTATGGFTPTYRIALSTVISQSKVDKVLVGDTLAYNYYQYPIGYVDSSYVYLGTRVSIRGSTGAAGTTPVKGTDYFTDAEKTEMVNSVIAALPSETWTFELEDGTTVTKKVVLA